MAFVSSFLPPTIRASSTRARPAACARAPRMTAAQRVSQYDALRAMTTIVEDTGEIELIKQHKPYAATTNPSLVAKAATLPEYAHLVDEAVAYGRGRAASAEDRLAIVRNKLFTLFGAEILKHIPGDVSTEVDARLSFDADAQIRVAEELIAMYDEVGVGRERVLVKLATTWEGVEACRALQARGINTNMTLLFNQAQAVAAADANAFLISPFVGRILDFHKKERGVDSIPAEEDPGVLSVRAIYNYYKCHGHSTVVMGASFRTLDEILALAGCDRLTIAPKFVQMLKDADGDVARRLGALQCGDVARMEVDEKRFRWEMNEDAMATEKLAGGIRGFARDLEKLDKLLIAMI